MFKNIMIGLLIFVIAVGGLIGLSYGFGWIGVHQTKTIGKAKKNAQREVFEETNSFTKAKRQEAIKYFKEYNECDSDQDRKAIEYLVSMSLADFNEDRFIKDQKLLSWIKQMKY